MAKIILICGKCYNEMLDKEGLQPLPRPKDEKAVCGICGRKRFCGKYETERHITDEWDRGFGALVKASKEIGVSAKQLADTLWRAMNEN